MSEFADLNPDGLIHITVKAFEEQYVSRAAYDQLTDNLMRNNNALRAQLAEVTAERDALRGQVEAMRWIPVDPTVTPPFGELVLVSNGKNVHAAKWVGITELTRRGCKGWHEIDGMCMGDWVRYWRPLPQPPAQPGEVSG